MQEGHTYRSIANILTFGRIILSIALLFLDVFTFPFYAVYSAAGITDMIDGYVARRTGSVSAFGARLDSMADLVLVAVCLIKVIPAIDPPVWLCIWVGIIVFIKAANVISGYEMFKRIIFLHTRANKITGLMLFASMFFLDTAWMEPVAIIVCLVATYAAAQEGHFIRTERWDSE